MRITSAAFAVLCLMSGHAQAAVRWVGELVIVKGNGDAECKDQAGFTMQARFRPAGLSDNGPNSNLSVFFNAGGGENYEVKGKITKKFREGKGTGIADLVYLFENKIAVKFDSSDPEKITEKTNSIQVKGQIRSFGDLKDCDTDFKMVLLRRID